MQHARRMAILPCPADYRLESDVESPYNRTDNRNNVRKVANERWQFWFDEDLDFFDFIQEYSVDNAYEEAMKEYGSTTGSADSIIQIVYGLERIDYVLTFDTANTLSEERRLYQTQLLTQGLFLHSVSTKEHTFVKVVVPFHCLCLMAERQNLRMYLKKTVYYIEPNDLDKEIPSRFQTIFGLKDPVNLNQMTAVFRTRHLAKFRGSDDQSTFFKPFHRALLSKYILEITRASTLIKTFGIADLIADGAYTNFFLLHISNDVGCNRKYLDEKWIKSFGLQPISVIREYFGEKIALYFGFCGFYFRWLIFPSVAGLAVVINGLIIVSDLGISSSTWRNLYDNKLTPYFGIFMNLWATTFLEFWKRRNCFFALNWGVLELKQVETIRHGFKASKIQKSLITGTDVPYFPSSARLLRQSVTLLAVTLMLAIVSLTIYGQTLLQVNYIRADSFAFNSILISISGYVFISILRFIFSPIAERLSTWENYETESVQVNSRNLKLWSFIFANVFSVRII